VSITKPEELKGLVAAGRVARLVLEGMRLHIRPGVTTAELDFVGARIARNNGARSAPAAVYGFPGFNCISVNEEVVHGIPGQRVLREGDLVKLDVTVEKNGYLADSAVTVPVGIVPDETRRLIDCAERAFRKAMLVAREGFRIFEIGRAVETEVRRSGFSVIRELGGHGIGRTIHEEPTVPNCYDPRANQVLTEGLVITVEPILAAGRGDALLEKDGWTIRTADRSLSAHYEHTIAITRAEPLLLTAA
jgi:methionyl aminopeptidase